MFASLLMKRAALLVMLVTSTAFADGWHFSASDVRGTGIKQPGRIVIRNDARSITTFRFFGNVREALMTLRSTRVLAYSPFGAAVYSSSASVPSAMPAYLSAMMVDAGRTHGIDPRLLAAVANRESAFNPRAVSPVGACGIMQIMPATARFLGINDIFNARENVFGGARYLRTLLDTFHGDLDLTLAAYNAGPGAVQKYNGVPPYRETRAYVASVRAAYERALR
jgi:soluble lytic murein transglycosylase-like protein